MAHFMKHADGEVCLTASQNVRKGNSCFLSDSGGILIVSARHCEQPSQRATSLLRLVCITVFTLNGKNSKNGEVIESARTKTTVEH